jgi:hypothetical protein
MLKKHQCSLNLKDNCLHIGEEFVPFLAEKDIPKHEGFDDIPSADDIASSNSSLTPSSSTNSTTTTTTAPKSTATVSTTAINKPNTTATPTPSQQRSQVIKYFVNFTYNIFSIARKLFLI